ncbi:hypothetical protein CJ030_MR5G009726 [Morella rubra]|uniref:Uncharacterized protein n=1 Tax=Morella rubra TaxID=262757 RepID=A0A6A1VIR5_9ROSI|nr:hypothetical protein CJ030_MR5G009726 [Morella rubra]
MEFDDQSIGNIMDDQSWIGFLKRTGSTSVDLVREFYATLLDVRDIDAPVSDITLREVSFQLLAEVPATFMGMQRLVVAFPAMDILNKLDQEEIFRELHNRDVVVVGVSIRRIEMLPFWGSMHFIFAYDIEPRDYTT